MTRISIETTKIQYKCTKGPTIPPEQPPVGGSADTVSPAGNDQAEPIAEPIGEPIVRQQPLSRKPKGGCDCPDLGPDFHDVQGGLSMDCGHCGYTRHVSTRKIGEANAVARFLAWQAACPAKGTAWREGDAERHRARYRKRLLAELSWTDLA